MKIVFDFDGTIHKTHIIYQKAMEISLKEVGIDIKDIDFKSLIGKSPHCIWKSLGVVEEKADSMVEKTGAMMDKNMKSYGKLFEGSIETLEYLKEKYQLIICSNCRNSYMRAARDAYELDKYFTSYITGEDHNYDDKYKILKNLNLGDFIMVGDRKNDIDAGYKNMMKTVFAKYGYGDISEGEDADFLIEDIRELKNIL